MTADTCGSLSPNRLGGLVQNPARWGTLRPMGVSATKRVAANSARCGRRHRSSVPHRDPIDVRCRYRLDESQSGRVRHDEHPGGDKRKCRRPSPCHATFEQSGKAGSFRAHCGPMGFAVPAASTARSTRTAELYADKIVGVGAAARQRGYRRDDGLEAVGKMLGEERY